ncbi:MAG: phage virion morphogenesis protein [Lentisphaerae bacterium]|nr:phage virion morphogenesis protein [Lentisphaerota bacterium]
MKLTYRDGITPSLKSKIRRLENRRPVLKAMGGAVVSLAKSAFTDPGVRPLPWPPRKKKTSGGGRDRRGRFVGRGHALLIKSTELRKSLYAGEVTNTSIVVGSPKVYAPVHQFGSRKKTGRGSNIPPRPFFPTIGKPPNARLTPRAGRAVRNAARRQVNAALGI